jgi:hypothetical protein
LEIEMKTTQLIGTLALMSAMLAAGPAFAEVGIMDGANPFADFVSHRTRAEVQAEITNQKTQDASPNVGVYGPSGARYATPAPAETHDRLAGPQTSHAPAPQDIYFGD